MLRKFMSVIICFLLLVSVFTVYSYASNDIDTANLKQQLIKKAPKVSITDEKEKDRFSEKVSQDFKDLIDKEGYNQAKIDEFFKSKGFIKFNAKKAIKEGIDSLFSAKVEASSQASNTTMNSPSIYYSTNTGRWTAVGGGYWNNLLWTQDAPRSLGYIVAGNVGGHDMVGLHFSNLKNSSGTRSAVLKQELYTRGSTQSTHLVSTSRLNSDSSYGVFFSYQDATFETVSNGNSVIDYNLDGFAVLLEFDSVFAQVNGIAVTGYDHTYSNTSITGVTLSNSGWSATITGSANEKWSANSADTSY